MAHKPRPNRVNKDINGGVPVYFYVYQVGTFPTCSGWWSEPPTLIRPNVVISISPLQLDAVRLKEAQFTFWGYEYICNTTKQITTGPCGIDLDTKEGCTTIHWRAPHCKCTSCRAVKPYERRSPGTTLEKTELIIPEGR